METTGPYEPEAVRVANFFLFLILSGKSTELLPLPSFTPLPHLGLTPRGYGCNVRVYGCMDVHVEQSPRKERAGSIKRK